MRNHVQHAIYREQALEHLRPRGNESNQKMFAQEYAMTVLALQNLVRHGKLVASKKVDVLLLQWREPETSIFELLS